ncbi:MAG TPA: DUF3619 family protein [Burkholderiales bacterium]|jgi:hypothetical protein|nr:DUF3619 family protein [Burkholderiales bacterium]
MNERQFAQKIRPWLARTEAGIDEMQAARLKAARLRALDAVREPVRLFGLVTVSDATAQTVRYSIVQRALLWLPMLALLATLGFQSMRESDLGAIDAQLLTQELPPDAFLDQDFRAWLDQPQG